MRIDLAAGDGGGAGTNYDKVLERLKVSLETNLDNYAMLKRNVGTPFYNYAGSTNQIAVYQRNRMISLICTEIFIAAHRLNDKDRSQLFSEGVPSILSNQPRTVLGDVVSDFAAFRTDIHPADVATVMKRWGLVFI